MMNINAELCHDRKPLDYNWVQPTKSTSSLRCGGLLSNNCSK